MGLEILLRHEAAERVSDDYRGVREALGNFANVLDIVGDRTGSWRHRIGARAVPAEAHGDRAISVGGEKVEKAFVPTPGGMLAAVDEKQWCRMGFAD